MNAPRCSNCGAAKLNGYTGKPDRKCRRCGEYWPAPGSVIGPQIDAQFRGASPYGHNASLAEIVRVKNNG